MKKISKSLQKFIKEGEKIANPANGHTSPEVELFAHAVDQLTKLNRVPKKITDEQLRDWNREALGLPIDGSSQMVLVTEDLAMKVHAFVTARINEFFNS